MNKIIVSKWKSRLNVNLNNHVSLVIRNRWNQHKKVGFQVGNENWRKLRYALELRLRIRILRTFSGLISKFSSFGEEGLKKLEGLISLRCTCEEQSFGGHKNRRWFIAASDEMEFRSLSQDVKTFFENENIIDVFARCDIGRQRRREKRKLPTSVFARVLNSRMFIPFRKKTWWKKNEKQNFNEK